jgi:hypothetical protein
MKQQSDLEKRLEEALSSLDGLQRATPQPWLFSRVKGRLLRSEEKTKWEVIGLLVQTCRGDRDYSYHGTQRSPSFNQNQTLGVTSQTELALTDSESLIASSVL